MFLDGLGEGLEHAFLGMELGEGERVSVDLGRQQRQRVLEVALRAGGGQAGADPLEPAVPSDDRLLGCGHGAHRIAEAGAADPRGVDRDLGPRRGGAAQGVSLAPVDVEVGERGDLVERPDPLRADDRAGAAGEAHEGLDQGHARGVLVDALGEDAVELDDVRLHPRQLPQARVAGAGVVHRDASATLTQVLQCVADGLVLGDRLVLGDLDHDLA